MAVTPLLAEATEGKNHETGVFCVRKGFRAKFCVCVIICDGWKHSSGISTARSPFASLISFFSLSDTFGFFSLKNQTQK